MKTQRVIFQRAISRFTAATLLTLSIGLPNAATATGIGNLFRGLTVIGLTDDGRLVRFSTRSPGRTQEMGFVSGLVGQDTSLIGIDYRVQNGLLYGVGNRGGVYTIDLKSGQAILITKLTVPLAGKFFGVDFNPAADALRVVSNTGQNLRHPFSGPTMFQTQKDGTLTYPATTTTPAITAKGVTGSAYTNNDLNTTTSTTLFGIDTNLDQVVIQSPANAGLLAATGSLGINAGSQAGFDNYSRLRGGATVDVQGYATLFVNNRYSFYQVELLTGKTTSLGSFREPVVDIALPLNQ